MKKAFSKAWKASKQPRKQRKFRANAPFHIRDAFASSHVSKELAQKHNTRNMIVKKGDKVKVLRGSFKGKEGNIASINRDKATVCIDGFEVKKRSGTVAQASIHASNVLIVTAIGQDKKRFKRGKKNESTT